MTQRGQPTQEWPLDLAHVGDIAALKPALPELPVVCSDMRRAIGTASFFGTPTIDARLAEVSRPWSDDLDAAISRYFGAESLDGWEPQADVRARMQAVVADHGDAIYVSHGTVLSLYLASLVPALEAMRFWSELRNPDAWELDGSRLSRVSPPRA